MNSRVYKRREIFICVFPKKCSQSEWIITIPQLPSLYIEAFVLLAEINKETEKLHAFAICLQIADYNALYSNCGWRGINKTLRRECKFLLQRHLKWWTVSGGFSAETSKLQIDLTGIHQVFNITDIRGTRQLCVCWSFNDHF